MKYMKKCGVWYNAEAAAIDNGVDFDSLFRAKYGKGYVSSEPEMRAVMLPRVERIIDLAEGGVRLVDIGTAYGTFLTCLPQIWASRGVEPMSDVANYASTILKRRVWCGKADTFEWPCNVATMWNVIEHLESPEAAIANIYDNLYDGGLICISTPNADGGYFRYRRDEYEKNDDPSHRWVFSPKTLSELLRRHNFKIEKVVITGHHPERWGGGMLRSRLFRLGDTFEIYARKRGWI